MLPITFNKYYFSKGQSYIEVIITIAILSILFAALFALVTTSYELISFTRSRITAIHLAQEKMEIIRNLPYDNLGTIGGIPMGELPQNESITRNDLSYDIETSIVYVDDPFDGLAPNDTLPTDYKKIRVEVSWGGIATSRKNPVVLVSDIAPRGVESTEGGGTLSILVFNASGQIVSNADITIIAEDTDPQVNLSLQTDNEGMLILPGAPECTSCYQITVSKQDFSSERTYSTSEVANPAKPHLTIIEGELTETSFVIDQLSNLTINTVSGRSSNFNSRGNVAFNLTGDKIIGTDTEDNPVHKFNHDLNTNSLGILTLEDIEWDNYTITFDTETYDISGTNPLLPIRVIPNSDPNYYLTLNLHTENNLLLSFTNGAGNQIATVSAILKDNDQYEETLISGTETDPDFGQVFFSNLESLDYSLTTSAVGYATHSADVSVSETTQEIIILIDE